MSSRSSPLRRAGQLRPFLVSYALFVFSLTLTAMAVSTPWADWPLPIIAVTGTAASVALPWRRRMPVLVTMLGAAALLFGSNPVPLWVGLYTIALGGPRRPRGTFVAVAALGTATMALYFGPVDITSLVAAGGTVGIVMGLGAYAGARQQLLISAQERAHRAESERLLRDEQARSEERSRIAKEMHDVLGHKMTLIAIQAGALEVTAGAGPERVEKGAELIRMTAREALEELRTVLGVLRNESGDAIDFPDPFPDVRRLVDASTSAGVAVDLRDDVGPLPLATARAVYRVVQEGLTNVHKHAPGAEAAVAITGPAGGEVTVVVSNGSPGSRGDELPGAGVGLIGLSERLRLLGGTLHSGPDGAGGWRLEAMVPWLAVPAEDRQPVGAGAPAEAEGAS